MAQPQRKCFLCCKTIRNRKVKKQERSKLNDQLTVVFLVSKILKVSNDKCAEFLENKGNPSNWCDFCSACKSLVKDYENTSKEIVSLEKKLIDLNGKIEQRITDSVITETFSECKDYDVSRIIRKDFAKRLQIRKPKNETREETFSENTTLEIKAEPQGYESDVDLENHFQSPTPEQDSDRSSEHEDKNSEYDEDDEELPNENKEMELSSTVDDTENPIYVKPEKVDGFYPCKHCGKSYKFLGSHKKHFKVCRPAKLRPEEAETRKTRSGNRYKYTLTEEELYRANREFHGKQIPTVLTNKNYIKKGEFNENFTHECKACKNKYEDSKALFRHSLFKHGIELSVPEQDLIFTCSDCPEKFSAEALLTAHIRTQHNGEEMPFQCKICKSLFRSYPGYIRHCENAHLSDGPVTCNQCSLHFYDERLLQIHIGQAHEFDKRPYKCSVCLRGLTSEIKMHFHRRCHVIDREYMCEFCSLGFFSSDKLKNHQLRVHNEELGLPLLKCGHCDRQFGKDSLLKEHVKASHGNKDDYPFSCTICIRGRFRVEANLKAHMITYHTGEKKYQCLKCPRRFRMNRQLSRHKLKEHSGNYPKKIHICDICNETFPERMKLRIHLAKIHIKKPFQCPECRKCFGFKHYLRKHMRNVHKVVDFDTWWTMQSGTNGNGNQQVLPSESLGSTTHNNSTLVS